MIRKAIKLVRGTWLAILVVGLLVAGGRQALAQGGGWSTPVMLSTNTASSWFSAVAVDDWGRPHVIWNTGRSTEDGIMDLLMYSTPGGDGEWLEPNDIELTAYGGYTIRPSIAVDKSATLHATFRGEVTIYYTSAPASEAWNAASWTSRRMISGAGGESAYYSDIAVDEQGTIHIVWNESMPAGEDERWLWFGTPQGSVLYDGRDWRSLELPEGWSDRNIYAIIEDDAGVQWFGTDDGVYRYDGGTWQRFTVQDGLVAQKVNCVAQDVEGTYWFGTDSGVSQYYVEERRDIWTAHTVYTGLPDNTVRAMATDHLGRVWVGTDGGLAVYDNEKWVKTTSQDGLAGDQVLSLAVDDRGDVWAGTAQGLSHYDGRRWTSYSIESGLLSNVVTAIDVGRDGTIWFGTDRGVNRFDGQEWTSYTPGEGGVSGGVTSLMVDSEGVVWVGNEAGVSRYDGRTWSPFELPGSAGQRVQAIAEDRQVNAICPQCADIFYRHSTDGGSTWSAPVNLSDSFGGSAKPQVHVGSGGHVYVTWEEGEDWYTHLGYPITSMFTHSSDGGHTWMDPVAFTSPLGPPQQITLGVVGQGGGQTSEGGGQQTSEGNLVVVWRPSGEDRLLAEDRFYYQLSGDHGATWSEPQPIPGVIAKPWTPFSLDGYHTATDGAGNVHLLVLGRQYSLEEDLGLMHLVWNGSGWSAPNRVYASKDPPEWPRIDVGAGNEVCATWFTRDEKHVIDTEGGRYKVWVSCYQASAPPQTPVPIATPTPTPTTDAPGLAAATPTSTPLPAIDPDSSGLPPGLFTESDEIGRLALALSPIIFILFIIVALRLGRRVGRR